MGISGHKTRSVFERYNIVDPADLREAAAKIEKGAEKRAAEGSRGGLMDMAYATEEQLAEVRKAMRQPDISVSPVMAGS